MLKRPQHPAIGQKVRLSVLLVFFSLAFFVIALRLFDLAYIAPTPVASGKQADGFVAIPKARSRKARADIKDRNGVLLASNLFKPSLCANGRVIRDPESTTLQLMAVLPELDVDRTIERMKRDKQCMFIMRGLSPQQQFDINRLGIIGLDFVSEQRRVYPQGALMSHVVGFTNPDNKGLAGMEQALDNYLVGRDEPVYLSIDVRLQNILSEELQRSIERFEAKAGAAVVLDAQSAEVLALVSLPTFNPESVGDASASQRFNRSTLGTYEMGSILKLFTAAMALDSGDISLKAEFDATAPIAIPGTTFRIRDFTPENRWLTLEEVIKHSSNIGTARIAEQMGTQAQQAFLSRLGLLTPLPIELPEVGKPGYPAVWRPVNTMTISYGHGLSVSPLQIATAATALVNGGTLHHPTLIRQNQARKNGSRVLKTATSGQIRDLMALVVNEGTGKKAQPLGYRVGGKTGTADKPGRNSAIDNKRIASFLGAFPIEDPKYVIVVMVDEPVPQEEVSRFATGGHVAAPVVRNFVQRAAPVLGIAPSDPQALSQAQWMEEAE